MAERSTDNRKAEGSNPFRPNLIKRLKFGPNVSIMSNLSAIQTQEQEQEQENPMEVFLYALRAPESKRQYPKRLKMLFDFLGLSEPLDNQAHEFLRKGRDNPQWAYKSFIRFIIFQKERAKTGEICESTISNYYKAAKLFCEMNDVVLNWKKIAKGIPWCLRDIVRFFPRLYVIRPIFTSL